MTHDAPNAGAVTGPPLLPQAMVDYYERGEEADRLGPATRGRLGLPRSATSRCHIGKRQLA